MAKNNNNTHKLRKYIEFQTKFKFSTVMLLAELGNIEQKLNSNRTGMSSCELKNDQ